MPLTSILAHELQELEEVYPESHLTEQLRHTAIAHRASEESNVNRARPIAEDLLRQRGILDVSGEAVSENNISLLS